MAFGHCHVTYHGVELIESLIRDHGIHFSNEKIVAKAVQLDTVKFTLHTEEACCAKYIF